MSQYVVRKESRKFVFGWDQPLQSFFLQVHDEHRAEDDQIIAWLGATSETEMYEVEQLTEVAMQYGLYIDHPMRIELYEDKDDGR
jgi:hypothetical protein